jgi:glycosyltransferase involved in cell wall biosynthesis
MKNGLFITGQDLYTEDAQKNGVIKKIFNQIFALNIEEQLSCKPLILPRPVYNPVFLFFLYLLFDIYKNISSKLDFFDYVYIRRIFPVNYSFIKLLKMIRRKNERCKIVYEIPTYPYDREHKKLLSIVALFIDKIFRVKLKKYIDKIVTVSDDDVIFGVPTIKIKNGICCNDIQIRTPQISDQNLHLIVVAQFAFWHGYDRLIHGLNDFYKKNGVAKKVYVHFVGNGPEMDRYNILVKQYNLSEYVIFYGLLSGEKLTEVFNKADIAVCSLGSHRKGIYFSSELKSREYLVRGMPIVSSTKIDILPPDFKYCLYVPEDDSPVNIQHIIEYHQNLIKEQTVYEMIHEIRAFAENNCDISKTMRPVIEYFL